MCAVPLVKQSSEGPAVPIDSHTAPASVLPLCRSQFLCSPYSSALKMETTVSIKMMATQYTSI